MKPTATDKPYEQGIQRKFSASKFPPRPIPKDVLTRTLEIANNPTDEFWTKKNSSCSLLINYELNIDMQRSETYYKLNLARNCLLQRDWRNLAKLLTSNLIGDSELQKSAFPIYAEYASILLMLKDPELHATFKQTMGAANTVHAAKKIKKKQLNASKSKINKTNKIK